MSIDEAFTRFPSLTTNRLHLRQIQLAGAEALFTIKSGDGLLWRRASSVSRRHLCVDSPTRGFV